VNLAAEGRMAAGWLRLAAADLAHIRCPHPPRPCDHDTFRRPPPHRPRPTMSDPAAPPGGHRSEAPSDRTRIRRKPDRGHYDRATIDAILDAALVAHVGFVVDGQPYVIPTFHWRDGDRVYWHGSTGSRMIRMVASGAPACLTVSLIDSLVLARSGFNHSADYRSVVVVGTPTVVADEDKPRALDAFVDSLVPGRAATLRPMTDKELKQTAVVSLPLDEASAKVRDSGLGDDPGDETWPTWAGTIPVRLAFGTPVPAADLPPDIELPDALRRLEER
jgi:nitroimidazol reductase NimA-like FMN-containing flavoprotein (pyridoxamine 5'-phosphate oxidase superfamily)